LRGGSQLAVEVAHGGFVLFGMAEEDTVGLPVLTFMIRLANAVFEVLFKVERQIFV